MTKSRFGKSLELEGFGRVIEILPHVFTTASDANAEGICQDPFFDRFVRTRPGRFGDRVEIPDHLFRKATRILGHQVESFDLCPGLNWEHDPVGFAALIAAGIHLNQQDKLGFPYIEHPRRVFLNSELSLKPEDFSEAERVAGYQAAWLHDVIEDSKEYFYRPIGVDDLSAWGISGRAISVVSRLTRPEDKSETDNYYRQILLDATARAVKLADIADNLASWRVALLPPDTQSKLQQKYEMALGALLFDDDVEGDWFDLRIESFDEGPWPIFALPESHQALKRAKETHHFAPRLKNRGCQDDSPEQLLSRIQSQAAQILQERTWWGLDPSDSNPDWPKDISLEAWYSAYMMLFARGQARNGDPGEAEYLASVIDEVNRDEVSLQFRILGLVEWGVSTSDVKLRLPRALQLMRDATTALEDSNGYRSFNSESHERAEHVLQKAESEALLDATVLAFSSVVPWSIHILKYLLVELTRRMAN
jgi:hypothetical protein